MYSHRSNWFPSTLPQVTLQINRGRTRQRVREVHVAAFLIGSAEDCDLVLADPRFPEVHAYLIRHNDGVSLRYLGSKPAMTVNGRLMRHARLADGDRIESGPYEFTVHIQPVEAAPLSVGPMLGRLSADRRRAVESAQLAEADFDAVRLLRAIRATMGEAGSPIRVYQEPGANVAI